MADPIPTPEAPKMFSGVWWWKQIQMLLPTNWRQIIQWLVLAGLIQLANYLRGPNSQPIPVPDFPELNVILPDNTQIDPDTMQEMERRGIHIRRMGWKADPTNFVVPANLSLSDEQLLDMSRRGVFIRHTGWHKPSKADTRDALQNLQTPKFADTEAGQADVGDSDAPVWRLMIKARGRAPPDRDQGQIGSCVSFGFSTAVEYTMAAQVALSKERQELPDSCQEALYGGSRVEANGGLPPEMRGQDGSSGAWAAKWLETVGGVLPRGKYGSVDLTTYSVSRCKQWGDAGVPSELEAVCKKHPAKCTMIQNATEAKVALSQGYAIGVCSDVGFDSMTRDKDGFIRAQGQWPHCMAIIGYRGDRPGFLIENSWGSGWVKGPKGKFADIPDGSFWVDSATVDRMLKQQDSFAVANSAGFVRRVIKPEEWIVQKEFPRDNLLAIFETTDKRGWVKPVFALGF